MYRSVHFPLALIFQERAAFVYFWTQIQDRAGKALCCCINLNMRTWRGGLPQSLGSSQGHIRVFFFLFKASLEQNATWKSIFKQIELEISRVDECPTNSFLFLIHCSVTATLHMTIVTQLQIFYIYKQIEIFLNSIIFCIKENW